MTEAQLDAAFKGRLCILCLVAMSVLALLVATFWFMSPLGLGFRQWPTDEPRRTIIVWTMNASYFVGIPALLIAQITAWVYAVRRRYKRALYLSGFALVSFVSLMAVVLSALS